MRHSVASFSVASFAVAVFAVACAAEDVASPTSGRGEERVRSAAAPVSDAGAAGDAGGGAVPVPADAGSCPAPVASSASGLPPVWSRNPETGACCRYESSVAAPPLWPYFESEAECGGSCRCSVLEGFIEDVGEYDTERGSLECRCSAETCPSSVADAERLLCSRASFFPVVRREGCGRVMIVDANGFSGDAWIFERSEPADAGGERLIGAGRFGDVAFAPCRTYEWVAGRSFDCDEATACQLCGDEPAIPPVPPCE